MELLALLRLPKAASYRGSPPREVETLESAIVSSSPLRLFKANLPRIYVFLQQILESLCKVIDRPLDILSLPASLLRLAA